MALARFDPGAWCPRNECHCVSRGNRTLAGILRNRSPRMEPCNPPPFSWPPASQHQSSDVGGDQERNSGRGTWLGSDGRSGTRLWIHTDPLPLTIRSAPCDRSEFLQVTSAPSPGHPPQPSSGRPVRSRALARVATAGAQRGFLTGDSGRTGAPVRDINLMPSDTPPRRPDDPRLCVSRRPVLLRAAPIRKVR